MAANMVKRAVLIGASVFVPAEQIDHARKVVEHHEGNEPVDGRDH